MKPLKALFPIALVLSGGALIATTAQAQFGGIGTVVKALPVKGPAVPNLLNGPAPISTNIGTRCLAIEHRSFTRQWRRAI
jgi:hypothetical protein